MGNMKTNGRYPLNKQYLKYLEQFLVQNREDPRNVDLIALWDSGIPYESNKENIAAKLGIPYNRVNRQGTKRGTQEHYVQNPKHAKKELDEGFCDFLADNCETKCNNGACKAFRVSKCPGTVEPCAPSRWNKTARRKSPGTKGDCNVVAYKVEAHTRPPQHNSRTGKDIIVKGYTVMQHPRLCRRSGYG
jgi:hypothetical protein